MNAASLILNDLKESTKKLQLKSLNASSSKVPIPFNLIRFHLVPGGSTDPESHPSAEIWIVHRGTGILTCNNISHSVQAGGIYFIEPFAEHSVFNSGEEELFIDAIFWKPSENSA